MFGSIGLRSQTGKSCVMQQAAQLLLDDAVRELPVNRRRADVARFNHRRLIQVEARSEPDSVTGPVTHAVHTPDTSGDVHHRFAAHLLKTPIATGTSTRHPASNSD